MEKTLPTRRQSKVLNDFFGTKHDRIPYFHKQDGHSVCYFNEAKVGIKDGAPDQRSLAFLPTQRAMVGFSRRKISAELLTL